jgi:hypothetical protein
MQVIRNGHGARYGWRLLLCAAALALVSLPAAAVFFDPDSNSVIANSQSIESEITFDLMETNYDRMLEPAKMAFFTGGPEWYAQSGNTGGINQFQFGHHRPLGPGHGSVRFNYATNSDEVEIGNFFENFSESPFTDDTFPFPPDQTTANLTGELEREDMGLFVGYGWQLGGGPVNQSIGLFLDYYTSSTDVEGSVTNLINDNEEDFGGENETFTVNDSLASDTEMDQLTLGVEWMRKGNNGVNLWLRGLLQDVDNTAEDSIAQNFTATSTDVDAPTPPPGSPAFSCEFFPFWPTTSDGSATSCGLTVTQTTSLGFRPAIVSDLIDGLDDFLGRGNGYGSLIIPGTDFQLGAVNMDGQRFGIQAEVGLTNDADNPWRFRAGFLDGSFDPKEDVVLRESFLGDFTIGAVSSVLMNATEQRTLDSDLTSTDYYLDVSRFWVRGPLNVGATAALFSSKTENELRVSHIDTSSQEDVDGGAVVFSASSMSQSTEWYGSEYTWQTFGLSTAATYQATPRIKALFGAQYLHSSWESEFFTQYMDSTSESTFDPDGAGAIAPTTSMDVDRFTDRFTFSTETIRSTVNTNAGAAFALGDHMDLHLMVVGGGYESEGMGYSNRNAWDFNSVYGGITLK